MRRFSVLALALSALSGLLAPLPAVTFPTFTHVGQTIELPSLDQLDQLMVLNDQWLVAVVDPWKDEAAWIDSQTGGQYTASFNSWVGSQTFGAERLTTYNPNWGALTSLRSLRPTYFQRARREIGEVTWAAPEHWRITSPDDATYATAQPPSSTVRALIPVDGQLDHPGTGAGEAIRYGIYVYLNLPRAMTPGRTYQIAFQNRKSGTMRFDLNKTVSRAIKVNQAGYRVRDAQKYAYIGGWLPGTGPLPLDQATSFDLVDGISGSTVFTGTPTVRDDMTRCDTTGSRPIAGSRPLLTGERLLQCDFSGYTGASGTFYLRVPGVGRSWPFRINNDVYGDAFYTAMKGMFHQRRNFALTTPYTNWVRPALHPLPVGESENLPFSNTGSTQMPSGYERFDVIGATADLTNPYDNVQGGWHDAADYDCILSHYVVDFDMLWLFERRPGVFTDNQLNIPESGNGIPDLLDEAEYGLRGWKRSQKADGSVAGWLETSTHAPYADRSSTWCFSQRTRWSSLAFAQGAAWYSRLVRPYNATMADSYAVAARAAYAFGSLTSNSLGTIDVHARTNRGKGDPYVYSFTETEAMVEPWLVGAKAEMYKLDGDPEVLNGVDVILGRVLPLYQWPNTNRDQTMYHYWHFANSLADKIPAALATTVKGWYTKIAPTLRSQSNAQPYRNSWPRSGDFYLSWGSSVMTNHNRQLFLADQIQPDPANLPPILNNTAFTLGANCFGWSWMTGFGCAYPVIFQHEWSEFDNILDPMPGIVPYGINENFGFSLVRDRVWKSTITEADGSTSQMTHWQTPEWPLWRRYLPHTELNVTQCEFTIHETMASVLLTTGMLMDPGYVPSAETKSRQPRPKEQLFGYWYLP